MFLYKHHRVFGAKSDTIHRHLGKRPSFRRNSYSNAFNRFLFSACKGRKLYRTIARERSRFGLDKNKNLCRMGPGALLIFSIKIIRSTVLRTCRREAKPASQGFTHQRNFLLSSLVYCFDAIDDCAFTCVCPDKRRQFKVGVRDDAGYRSI